MEFTSEEAHAFETIVQMGNRIGFMRLIACTIVAYIASLVDSDGLTEEQAKEEVYGKLYGLVMNAKFTNIMFSVNKMKG